MYLNANVMNSSCYIILVLRINVNLIKCHLIIIMNENS